MAAIRRWPVSGDKARGEIVANGAGGRLARGRGVALGFGSKALVALTARPRKWSERRLRHSAAKRGQSWAAPADDPARGLGDGTSGCAQVGYDGPRRRGDRPEPVSADPDMKVNPLGPATRHAFSRDDQIVVPDTPCSAAVIACMMTGRVSIEPHLTVGSLRRIASLVPRTIDC